MHKPTDTGMNRTGIGTSPIDSRRTQQGAEQAHTRGPLDGEVLIAERIQWARGADPLGTVPPPATLKGVMKVAIEKLEGHKPTVFIDKLGERLAFERTGTRLYEAAMAKVAAADAHPGGPARSDLELIRDAEHRHFAMLRDALLQLGADPTVMTPGADLVAVAGFGWVQAITDPRTTLNQCLDILLIAELADHGGWELLIGLAEHLEFEDLAHQFHAALVEEEQHVMRVRNWITTALYGEAAGTDDERTAPHAVPR
jgi:rubrerythrin